MMRITKQYHWVFVLITFAYSMVGQAQGIEKPAYYINLNASDGNRVFEVSNKTLSLQYSDAYGKWKEIPLKIYNWKRELVATLNLDKSYGLNNFVIQLDAIIGGLELNSLYTFELKDESGRQYELLIKPLAPPENKGPKVNIIVNPVEVNCDNISSTVVDFYGEITGGKAPYEATWFVLNSKLKDFLYQPREEVISTSGKTTSVRVDKNPEYYVFLFVKDACGNIEKKVANLACEKGRKKINTIFVENPEIINNWKTGK